MQFKRRQMAVLGVSIAAILLSALGFWAGYEYWFKPMDYKRGTTAYVYENWSWVLRSQAEYYETPSPSDAKLGLNSKQLLEWADWFDNRARILKSKWWFRLEEENRIYRDFRKRNPELSRWDEMVGRIW